MTNNNKNKREYLKQEARAEVAILITTKNECDGAQPPTTQIIAVYESDDYNIHYLRCWTGIKFDVCVKIFMMTFTVNIMLRPRYLVSDYFPRYNN